VGIGFYVRPNPKKLGIYTEVEHLFQAQVGAMYRPVYHHWFFRKEVETKVLWQPFNMVDSLALEEAFISSKF
jgi:hypothetical protein